MQKNNSQNAIKVIGRLKKSLKIKTDIELSEFLNIRPNTISTWKKRNSVDYDSIISICELYEIDLNHIFLDKKEAEVQNSETALVCREVQFQYCKDENTASLLEILPKYNIPFAASKNSRLFQVTSNNMFPVIDENAFVIGERIELADAVNNSVVIIISKEKGFFINRIRFTKAGAKEFILSSENDFYRDIKINSKEIKEIWNVKGVLSYDINSQNRLKFINDSIGTINKFMEKESGRLNSI